MIEAYTKKDKKVYSFNTNNVNGVLYKLRALKIINTIKYLLITTFENLSTYYCSNCKKRSYFETSILSLGLICKHCNTDNNLFFVGFKPSEKGVKHRYDI